MTEFFLRDNRGGENRKTCFFLLDKKKIERHFFFTKRTKHMKCVSNALSVEKSARVSTCFIFLEN